MSRSLGDNFAYSARQPLAKEKIAHCAEAKKQKYFSTNFSKDSETGRKL
jgi:hypothetical protein